MESQDPFRFLLEIGENPETIFLIGAPLVIVALVALIYVVLVLFKRRRESRTLQEAAEEEASAAEEKKAPPAETREIPEEVEDIRTADRSSLLNRLRQGLAKTRGGLASGLSGLFTGGARIDDETLEKLHEALYRADVGVETADKLVDAVRKNLPQQESADWETVSQLLKGRCRELLQTDQPVTKPDSGPWVILIVGVNGVGKTTTIGKLAARFLAEGKSVMMCAGDTYRAAAIEQLGVWGERLGVRVTKQQQGSDPAAVAYDGVQAAKARGTDVLLIDTAGRLHSRKELMDELGKIRRVIGRDLPGAPHETWLVIDATTGQNAFMQVQSFREVVSVTGLIVTKVDGTAKGGVLVGVSDKFGLPIRYVGVGEKASDLQEFDADVYAESMFKEG